MEVKARGPQLTLERTGTRQRRSGGDAGPEARAAGCPEKPGLGEMGQSAPPATVLSFVSPALHEDGREATRTASKDGLPRFKTKPSFVPSEPSASRQVT